MTAPKHLRSFAAGIALMATAGAAQADFIDEWVDGFYAEPGFANQRGLGLQYIPTGPEEGILFAAYYTYDEVSGEPTWVQGASGVVAGQYEVDITLALTDGGSFGAAPGSPSTTDPMYAQATVTMNHCSSFDFEVTSSNVTGFDNNFVSTLEIVDGVPNSQCVYQTSFAGCPDFATPAPGGLNEPRGCVISGEITESVTLTNDTVWYGIGRVYVGNQDTTDGTDNEGIVLTIEPGTRIIWGADGDPDAGLFVQMGARLNAQGVSHAPIVMTGVFPASDPMAEPQAWGGLIFHGRAPVNVCSGIGCATNEVDSSLYGGDDPNDSSGILTFTRVQFGGGDIDNDPERQYNGIAFHGVGQGTKVEYVQVHANLDDAFEWFGGTVNARGLVGTEMGDDGLDWVQGWRGRVQDALLVRTAAADNYLSADPRIIEGDGLSSNNEAEPRSKPWISNGTFLFSATTDGAVVRRGSGVNITNSLFIGSGGGNCFDLRDTATYEYGGTLGSPSGNVTINNSVVGGCATNFVVRADGTYTAQQWFDAQPENVEDDALVMDGVFLPDATYKSGYDVPYSLFDAFFQNNDWVGAFQNANTAWTHGWTLQEMELYAQ